MCLLFLATGEKAKNFIKKRIKKRIPVVKIADEADRKIQDFLPDNMKHKNLFRIKWTNIHLWIRNFKLKPRAKRGRKKKNDKKN